MSYIPTQAPPGMKEFDELRKWVEEEFRRVAQADATSARRFSTLPTPSAATQGTTVFVTDSNTNVWGATIAGGGANKVLAFNNGVAWTVAGK